MSDDGKSRRKSLFQAAKALTKQNIEDRLGFLSISLNNKHVFVELDLSGMRLSDIDALSGYVHLQILRLGHNSLTSLSALSSLPNLIYLDVPYNRNYKLFDFEPPANLREANYNHNVIATIPVLTGLLNLTKLQLDYNNIRKISYGLLFCKQLTHLSMCGNNIKFIDHLRNLPLRVLLLAGNEISEITNLETLVHLEVLDLSRNYIQRLTGLQGHYYLTDINLADNDIKNLQEFTVFGKLPALRTLNLLTNPVCENALYKSTILTKQQSILRLDGIDLSVSEKVKAISKIFPQKTIVSVQDSFVNSVLKFRQPLKISACSSDEKSFKYPILVLLGPLGSFKTALINRLADDFPEFWRKAKSHSTREPRAGEIKGFNYVSLAEFEHLQETGTFIQTAHLYGQHFGLSWEAINSIARDGFYPIVTMELEAILTLKWTNFHLYLVVAMTHDVEIQRTRLSTVLGLNEEIVQEAIDRRNVYFDYYNIDSGLFNMHINTDDLDSAYSKLKEMASIVKNEIIAEKMKAKNSVLQWKPSMDICQNSLEVDSFNYRRQRILSAFMHKSTGKLLPREKQFAVTTKDSDIDDLSYTPRSDFNLINLY